MKVLALAGLAASASALLAPAAMPRALVARPAPTADATVLEACRRNTKKEKRQRNQENMRKFKKGAPPTARGGGGKKKTMSRKKLTLKAQAAVEKGREATFMSKLFLATGGALEEKLDLGVL